MKRPLIVVALLTMLSLALAATTQAAPLFQAQKPVIAQPEQDAAVRGVVQLVGSAAGAQFQRYELYYAPSPLPSDQAWIFIGDAHFQPQQLGLLGTWDSRSVADGTYLLRVRMVRQDGNYTDSDPRRVLVTNTRAAPTPTSNVTPTSVAAAGQPAAVTPLPPTPTIVVALPTLGTPKGTTPTPTPAAAAGVTPTPASPTAGLDALFSGERLMDAAKQAAVYTLAAFLAVGLFFLFKGMLVWLWHRIRP